MAKKKKRTMADDAADMTMFGVTAGMGALTMAGVGAAAPAAAPFMAGSAAGLQTMSGFAPVMGTTTAAGHVIGGLQDLNKKVKKL